MSIIEFIIYGLVSGITEFLPLSSQGHQAVMLNIFGMQQRDPILDLLVHIAILAALLIACRPILGSFRYERQAAARRKKRNSDNKILYETRLIRTAGVPLAVCILFYAATRRFETSNILLALFFLINGILLIVPEYIRHGNKDARFMTGFDGVLMGFLGALSVFPGISRIGIMNGYILARGGDRQRALNWLLCLSIPALAVFAALDIYGMFVLPILPVTILTVFGYLLSAIAAFIAAYFGIVLLRFITMRASFAGFAYYAWGMSAFCFIIYLIT